MTWILDRGMDQCNTAKAVVALVFLACALGGCAPWVQVEGPYRMDSHNFKVNLPAGWRRATWVQDSPLVTRDGMDLQNIKIERVGVGQNLKHTKKKFAKGMLPQDVATLELDEVRSDQGMRNVEMLENVPFQVAGLPGFKLIWTCLSFLPQQSRLPLHHSSAKNFRL